MIEPYQAIGLVPTMWGIRRREEIAKNLEHLEHLFHAAFWLGGLDQPVKLVTDVAECRLNPGLCCLRAQASHQAPAIYRCPELPPRSVQYGDKTYEAMDRHPSPDSPYAPGRGVGHFSFTTRAASSISRAWIALVSFTT